MGPRPPIRWRRTCRYVNIFIPFVSSCITALMGPALLCFSSHIFFFFSSSRSSKNRVAIATHSLHFIYFKKGTRLGVSEHPEDNLNVFRFRLSDTDRADIEAVLQRSNGRKMITLIGDCGAEYR